MKLGASVLGLSLLMLASCVSSGGEDFSALRDKPPLPYSVLVTGGGFVTAPRESQDGELARTFVGHDSGLEAFTLESFRAILANAKVFVAAETDPVSAAVREVISGVEADRALAVPSVASTLERARAAGHDFVLVVERIQDGAVESRGINDRWPFTLAAWLFALGAFIPDRTYESLAKLQVSLRDTELGRQVGAPIVVEPGPVDLDMFERCGLWGFAQSIIIPPFFTSVDEETIVESMRQESTPRMLRSLVRRLKSAEVREQLQSSRGVRILTQRVGGGYQVTVECDVPIRAVGLRLDGKPLVTAATGAFEQALLASRQPTQSGLRYRAVYADTLVGQRLQVAVKTVSGVVRSMTLALRDQ